MTNEEINHMANKYMSDLDFGELSDFIKHLVKVAYIDGIKDCNEYHHKLNMIGGLPI